MIKQGLKKIRPDKRDYSILHTFGGTTEGLPENFSIYSGQPIPNQNEFDTRFTPNIRPLYMGCTAETTTFIAGLEDNALYPPDDFYFATPPGTDGQGRDIRVALQTAINRGFSTAGGLGAKRTAYFTCYGAGAIDDFDAVRIALWINQAERRGVSVGSWWYWGGLQNNSLLPQGVLQTPSFRTSEATLHNWLIVGWRGDSLIGIPWCGMNYGDNGLVYISRDIFNKLMRQPYTGCFTLTKETPKSPVPIGYQAVIDHFVAWFRQTFHV